MRLHTRGWLAGMASLVFSLAISSAAKADPVIVDTFNVGFQTLTNTGAGATTVGPITTGPHPVADIIGAFRTVSLTNNANGDPGFSSSMLTIATGLGRLSLATAADVDATAHALYNAGGAGLVSEDLTGLGMNDSIGFKIIFSDAAGNNATITVTDELGNKSTLNLVLPVVTGAAQNIFFKFALFTPVPIVDGGTGFAADFTDIDSILFDLDTALGGDITLDFVLATTSVPEPASICLLGLGLAGLAGGYRLRRRAQ